MIIIDGVYGGLCNQMFTFANLIAFAHEHDQLLLYPGFSTHASSFAYFIGASVCGFPRPRIERVACSSLLFHPRMLRAGCRLVRRATPGRWVNVGEKEVCDLDDREDARTGRLASAPFSVCSGFYFVGRELFAGKAALMREIFRPAPPVDQAARGVIAKARQFADVVVGVHVRQGDYRTFRNGLSFFSSEEYGDVMRRVMALFPDHRVAFVVCSDESQEGNFTGLPTLCGPGRPVEDLYTLAQCDYMIGPGSTFTQWASFYGAVPRYVMSWKWEAKAGRPETPLSLCRFQVHTMGFGSR